jgi:hypothetical protein
MRLTLIDIAGQHLTNEVEDETRAEAERGLVRNFEVSLIVEVVGQLLLAEVAH